MQGWNPFSGFMPSKEDIDYFQLAWQMAVLLRQRELFTDGVVHGLQVVHDEAVYILTAGLAYVNGERLAVNEQQTLTVDPTDGEKYVIIGYTTEDSREKQHPTNGSIHKVWRADSFEIVVRDLSLIMENELLLAKITATEIVDLRNFIRLAIDDRMHSPNSDTGTSSPEFRVGIGQTDTPEGLRVLTESLTPKPPLNIHITSIQPDRIDPASQSSENTLLAKQSDRTTGMAPVFFQWGYDNIIGESVSSNQFRIDTPHLLFEEDELKDYSIYFGSDRDFLITENEATIHGHTLITVSGDLHGLNANRQPAIIHPNVTEYHFAAIAVELDPDAHSFTEPGPPLEPLWPPGGRVLPERIEGITRITASPVVANCMLRLPLGKHFLFQVTSVRYGVVSQAVTMGPGTWYWKGVPHRYSTPFLVRLPFLGSASLSLTPLPNGKGFVATISGWNEAERFEYAWMRLTHEAEDVDFTNPRHHPGTSAGSEIEVVVITDYLAAVDAAVDPIRTLSGLGNSGSPAPIHPVNNSYRFAVRPLLSGQVVAEPITAIISMQTRNIGLGLILGAVRQVARNVDLMHRQLQNSEAIRQAQAARMEDQLVTLNIALENDGQHYSQFSVADDVTLPYPGAYGVDVDPLGDDLDEADSPLPHTMTFDLDVNQLTQTFQHDLGQQNYLVQVRDENGIVISAGIDLDDNQVTIYLSEPMTGTVLIYY